MQEHRSISTGAEPATHARLRANTTVSAVTLNFGPLNRDDGEPRHNVAEALARTGWQVHTQIGASSFGVDLGVVHPDFAGRYLSGVECDGATYHRSATARDRDKLRDQVLRGLGWEIVRIWSTDWWVNPGGTLERVHERLTALLTADRARRAAEEEARAAAEAAAAAAAEAQAARAAEEAEATIARAAAHARAGDGGAVQPGAEAAEAAPAAPAQAAVYARPVTLPEVAAAGTRAVVEAGVAGVGEPAQAVFRMANPAQAVPADALSAERFFDPGYDGVLEAMVGWVVQNEGPVLDAVLARPIARAHGFQRTGSRIQERVEAIARRLCRVSEEAVGSFYWPAEQAPGSPVPFRWPADEDGARTAEEICDAELAALARWVMQRTTNREEALVVMAREVGVLRLREGARRRLEGALDRTGYGLTNT